MSGLRGTASGTAGRGGAVRAVLGPSQRAAMSHEAVCEVSLDPPALFGTVAAATLHIRARRVV